MPPTFLGSIGFVVRSGRQHFILNVHPPEFPVQVHLAASQSTTPTATRQSSILTLKQPFPAGAAESLSGAEVRSSASSCSIAAFASASPV
jgi:hypothetical protein